MGQNAQEGHTVHCARFVSATIGIVGENARQQMVRGLLSPPSSCFGSLATFLINNSKPKCIPPNICNTVVNNRVQKNAL